MHSAAYQSYSAACSGSTRRITLVIFKKIIGSASARPVRVSRNGFGAHSVGSGMPVQVVHQLIRFARALQMFPLARLAVILRVADGVKAF